jgi:hypothetical protein
VVLSMPYLEDSSRYAEEGTDVHELAAECLISGKDAAAFEGRILPLGTEVSGEAVGYVQEYLDYIRERLAPGAELLVEKPFGLYSITKEVDAEGTPDAVVVSPADCTLYVFDLKYGKGVRVDADENLQLLMYAAAVYEEVSLYTPIVNVVMCIVQPRMNHVDPWAITSGELNRRVETLRDAADGVWGATAVPEDQRDEAWAQRYLQPGEDQCRWCRAKAACPALTLVSTQMVETNLEGLVDLDATVNGVPSAGNNDLARWHSMLPAIGAWCDAVKAEAFRRAEHGLLPGYKLVAGKRGSRAWTDSEAAEKALKSMRLKVEEMYDLKLISPTSAEKLLKDSPRRWTRLQSLVGQSAGKPTLVPASDPRPALAGGVAGLINSDVEDLV